jgi:hypothetical protein
MAHSLMQEARQDISYDCDSGDSERIGRNRFRPDCDIFILRLHLARPGFQKNTTIIWFCRTTGIAGSATHGLSANRKSGSQNGDTEITACRTAGHTMPMRERL